MKVWAVFDDSTYPRELRHLFLHEKDADDMVLSFKRPGRYVIEELEVTE